MPGRIIQGLRKAGCSDPVLLLDEIDKINAASSHSGDPAAALLEVLDPAQNHSFVDHYINVPVDLSKVMFIATANTKDSIPPALLDRMEVIEIGGYSIDEKVQIALKHLLPRQMAEHGLTDKDLQVPVEVLEAICESYTREAGVRNLERKIAAVCRAIVVRLLEERKGGEPRSAGGPAIVLKPEDIESLLGPAQFDLDASPESRVTAPGIAIGLSASAYGGNVMFVEAALMAGSGKVKLTGSLGDVIKESAYIALGWLRR